MNKWLSRDHPFIPGYRDEEQCELCGDSPAALRHRELADLPELDEPRRHVPSPDWTMGISDHDDP